MEGAALCRGQFHQAVGTVLPAQAEDREDQGRGRDCPEKDAEPPVHPGHVQDDEHEEDGEQAPGKDIEILRLQPAEFHAPVGPFVHFMFHDHRITGRTPSGRWRPRSGTRRLRTRHRRLYPYRDRLTRTLNTLLWLR